MIASRAILNSRCLLSKNILPFKKAGGESVRNVHVVDVPARVKVSAGENILFGVILGFAMFSLPAWVVYHLPDYQKEDRNVYTGK